MPLENDNSERVESGKKQMLFKNDVLEHIDTGNKLRVISLDPDKSEIWLFNMSAGKFFPVCHDLTDVETEMKPTGSLRMVAGIHAAPLITTSEAAKKHRDIAFDRIRPLVSTPDILTPKNRSHMVKARAIELGCSEQTLYSDLRKWWCNGQTRAGMTPNFRAKGSTAGSTSNRGRRPKYEDRPIFQMQETDIANIQGILNDYYLKYDFATLSESYQRLLELHYSFVDSEGHSYIKLPGEIPSEQQFRWLAKKLLPLEMAIRRRQGDAEFELNHRAKLGSLQHETYTVGEAFEIDATTADVWLVFSRNYRKIIGKPTLYLIFDRKSWLIVGFYVGLESPSWPAAMHAIKSIADDKEVLCKRYGVKYDPSDWPAHGIFPKEFIADRGAENLCVNSNQVAEGMDIGVLNLPSKRADQKPHVECGIKLIHQSIADSTPGYEPAKNFQKRQGNHYERDACLTLDQFTTIILEAIILFNRSPREGYIWPAEHILDGHQPIPREIWAKEIGKRAGALSRWSEEQVRFALLPKAEATVTREGIRLGTCFYTCAEAMSRGWMTAAARGNFSVSVSYDRRLVDAIYVHDPKDSTKFFVATLLDRCSDYRGLSFQEVEAIDYHREVLKLDGRGISRQNKHEFHQNVDPFAKKARAEMKQLAKGTSRTSRKKDIVEDRETERRARRQEEARLAPPIAPDRPAAEVIPILPIRTATAPQTPTHEQSDPSALSREFRLRQKRQEMLNGL